MTPNTSSMESIDPFDGSGRFDWIGTDRFGARRDRRSGSNMISLAATAACSRPRVGDILEPRKKPTQPGARTLFPENRQIGRFFPGIESKPCKHGDDGHIRPVPVLTDKGVQEPIEIGSIGVKFFDLGHLCFLVCFSARRSGAFVSFDAAHLGRAWRLPTTSYQKGNRPALTRISMISRLPLYGHTTPRYRNAAFPRATGDGWIDGNRWIDRRTGMNTRPSTTMVRFSNPFVLSGSTDQLPAGQYEVVTGEERLQGLSFQAYRRTATFLTVTQPRGADPRCARSPSRSFRWHVATTEPSLKTKMIARRRFLRRRI